MSREEALLTEYQVCQKEKHAQASTYWTIVGIFLSFATTLAGGLLYEILSKDLLIVDNDNVRWVIFGFSSLAVAIIISLIFWLKRTNYFINVANQRMRDIEDTPEMQMHLTNILCYLGKCNNLWPESHKAVLDKYSKFDSLKEGRSLKGKCIAKFLFIMTILPWVFLILISLFPCIIHNILNN